MASIRRIVLRSFVGAIAGVVIGLVAAALLIAAVPEGWIAIWKTETELEVHHLVWLLWATIAAVIALSSAIFGSMNLGRHASFVTMGVLCGCVASTTLALGSAWINDEWPYRGKAPQTSIDIGRKYLLPAFALIGGILGRNVAVRYDDRQGESQIKALQAKRAKYFPNGFVDDGFERALGGIEEEIRPEIEQRYADEWNASGLIKRWILARKIEKEIMHLVRERAKQISPDALF